MADECNRHEQPRVGAVADDRFARRNVPDGTIALARGCRVITVSSGGFKPGSCSSRGLVTAKSRARWLVGSFEFSIAAWGHRSGPRCSSQTAAVSGFRDSRPSTLSAGSCIVVVFADAALVDQPAGDGSSRSRANAAASSPAHGQFAARRRTARRAWKESRPAVCSSR